MTITGSASCSRTVAAGGLGLQLWKDAGPCKGQAERQGQPLASLCLSPERHGISPHSQREVGAGRIVGSKGLPLGACALRCVTGASPSAEVVWGSNMLMVHSAGA